MGTRIVYQVRDSDHNLMATLYSNSSHERQFAEDVFDILLRDEDCAKGPTALVFRLLGLRYMTASGNHYAGERIFWLVPAEEAEHGDREAVVTVTHEGSIEGPSEELAADLSTTVTGKWHKERKTVA